MVTAPDLFHLEHLSLALGTLGRQLAGPLGMATLSPGDPAYRPWYDNADQGSDYTTAHGFNYHQGPEWVWCMGFYLRAKLAAERRAEEGSVEGAGGDSVGGAGGDSEFYNKVLAPHRAMISSGPYRGLAELTNRNGEFCRGSCPTQAWSAACLLELLEDIRHC